MSGNNGKISTKEIETREANYLSYVRDVLSFYRDCENATKKYRFDLKNKTLALIERRKYDKNLCRLLRQFLKDERDFYTEYLKELNEFENEFRMMLIRGRIKYLYSVEQSDDDLKNYEDMIVEHSYELLFYEKFADELKEFGLED